MSINEKRDKTAKTELRLVKHMTMELRLLNVNKNEVKMQTKNGM